MSHILAYVAAAGTVLATGWWRPAPWLLALTVALILFAVWLLAVVLWLRLDDPDQALPEATAE